MMVGKDTRRGNGKENRVHRLYACEILASGLVLVGFPEHCQLCAYNQSEYLALVEQACAMGWRRV